MARQSTPLYYIVGGVARIVGMVPWPVRGVTAPQRGWSNSSEPMEDSSSLESYIMTRGGMLSASQSS